MAKRFRLNIQGIVQGVGFRPFVYQLAHRCRLNGYVANTPKGVAVEVEGDQESLYHFLKALPESAPPLANIIQIDTEELPAAEYGSFEIRSSEVGEERATLISPDTETCADCLAELFDPKDRRYRYPFINCTNCGPRYTIIDDIPYDRPKTSMASFVMCDDCSREYHDPLDRRFHAQPNGCWACGPRVWLTDVSGNELRTDDPIVAAAEHLKTGAIVAVKGLGGFHLAVDATQNEAVKRLRRRKGREEKPLAIMCSSLEQVERYALLGEEERRLLTCPQRPIVIVPKRERNEIAPEVAPRNGYFGVMLPYTPLHHLLLSHPFSALVMTSGNISEEPIAIDNEEALQRLGPIADYFLLHDRDILLRSDDSILRVVSDRPRQIRRSRGYVPVPVFLRKPVAPVLALGGELKGTICLTKGSRAFVGQHLGDLENLETLEFLEQTVAHLRRILEVQPRLLVHDLHPDYLTTQVAKTQDELPILAVQHHHAHVVSVMAEHGLEGRALGLALDGTGYGDDHSIWGGEILAADQISYERVGYLDNVPMPGGAAAIKEPWRMAVSYLTAAFGAEIFERNQVLFQRWDPERIRVLLQMIERKVNSPSTSSCGRLFDGIAALVGLRDRIAYEGQAAIELEQCLEPTNERYEYECREADGRLLMSPTVIFTQIYKDAVSGVPAGVISGKFHQTLVAMFTEACVRLGQMYGLGRVICSGGVFQNVFLLENLERQLQAAGLEVYTPQAIPANDACISLGQAVVGAASLEG
ncbi:MAG: carbamoyltransferase HypF [Deltaproteobacteria bacterium]|nr:MAG: carbamoyltransferase HypF [Deltaproteobacteria bacterium]